MNKYSDIVEPYCIPLCYKEKQDLKYTEQKRRFNAAAQKNIKK